MSKQPYPGIRPFNESESDIYFGREEQVRLLEEKLASNRFIAIAGVSGSGKSSLVKAGLIPRLKNHKLNNWHIATFRPQNSPVENLVAALSECLEGKLDSEDIEMNIDYNSQGIIECYRQSKLEDPLLIYIDQFEEVFRYKNIEHDPRKRHDAKEDVIRFMNLITRTVKEQEFPLHIIISLRSDFLGDCAEFKGLPEIINDSQFLIPRLTRNEYREAIINPAKLFGVEVSQLLASQLLNDIEDDPDQLPVLQHALMRTWHFYLQKHTDNVITLQHYEDVGGMKTALSKHANELFEKLDKKGLGETVKIVFQRITDSTNAGKEVRRPARVGELLEVTGKNIADLKTIIDTFRAEGVNFLMPPPDVEINEDTPIDISHESLMRKWDLLKVWMKEEQENKRMLKRLEEDYLLEPEGKQNFISGLLLHNALKWNVYQKLKQDKERHFVINWSKRYTANVLAIAEFIDKSKQKEERERWLKIGAALVFFVGMASVLIVTFVKDQQVKQARAQAAVAQLNAQKAEAERELMSKEREIKFLENKDSVNMQYTVQRLKLDSLQSKYVWLANYSRKQTSSVDSTMRMIQALSRELSELKKQNENLKEENQALLKEIKGWDKQMPNNPPNNDIDLSKYSYQIYYDWGINGDIANRKIKENGGYKVNSKQLPSTSDKIIFDSTRIPQEVIDRLVKLLYKKQPKIEDTYTKDATIQIYIHSTSP